MSVLHPLFAVASPIWSLIASQQRVTMMGCLFAGDTCFFFPRRAATAGRGSLRREVQGQQGGRAWSLPNSRPAVSLYILAAGMAWPRHPIDALGATSGLGTESCLPFSSPLFR